MGIEHSTATGGQIGARNVVLACALFIFFLLVGAAFGREFRICYVDAEQIYTSVLEGGDGLENPFLGSVVTRIETRTLTGQLAKSQTVSKLGYRERDTVLRWHVAHGYVWLLCEPASAHSPAAIRVPVEDVSIGAGARTTPGGPDAGGSGAGGSAAPPRTQVWSIAPVNELFFGRIDPPKKDEVCFDLLPTGANDCLLLVLKGSQFKVYEGTTTSPSNQPDRSVVQYKVTDRLGAGFQEPFNLFGNRERIAVVTRSGRMHLITQAGGRRSIKELWGNSDWPVVAVAVDVAAGTAFFLAQETTVDGGRKCLWLDKDGRLVERVIEPSGMKRLPFGRPLETCVPFAEYLRDQGLLAEKNMKKE